MMSFNSSSGGGSIAVGGKHLRSKLRSVMSDRVMRITRECSKQQLQQQNPKTDSDKQNVKIQRLLSGNASFNLTPTSDDKKKSLVASIKSPPANKLTDKKSLVEHCRSIYNDVVEKEASIVQSAKSIVDAIVEYAKLNSLESTTTVDCVLKESLFRSNIQLKQIYKNEATDQMKIEGQLQIALQLENYILANAPKTTVTAMVRVDEDFVWELANTVRWLSQTFKQRFKIEKFLFGEIYAGYHGSSASELVQSLMEELGYDKDDDDSDAESESPNKSANSHVETSSLSQKHITSPPTALSFSLPGAKSEPESSGTHLKEVSQNPDAFNTPVKRAPALFDSHKENCNSVFSLSARVTNIFEDTCSQANDYESFGTSTTITSSYLVEELSQTGSYFGEEQRDPIDLLDDFKRKKMHSRSNSMSLNTTTINRSIVVQKKRTKLKIRSPHKSPSTRFMEVQRKSPRIRDKQLLLGDSSRKRPRSSYLVTDTPDHKQNSTILTIKQEKIRKRFSIVNHSNSPVVPETPIKDENTNPNCEPTSETGASVCAAEPVRIISMNSRCRDLMFSSVQRSYSLSPKKNFVRK